MRLEAETRLAWLLVAVNDPSRKLCARVLSGSK